jgi:hypothetical protein
VPRLVALAVLLAALLTSGCGADTENGGGPDATTEVRATVAKFGVATRVHDWQTICDDLLSQTLVSKIEDVGLPCESAIEKGLGDVKNPTLQITDVSLAGARALVSIHTTANGQESSDDALQLVKEDGQWRIASLAAPAAGQSTTTPPTTSAPGETTSTAATVTTPTTTSTSTTKTTSTSATKTTSTSTTKTTATTPTTKTTSTSSSTTKTTSTTKGR